MLFFHHLPSSEDWLEDHSQRTVNTSSHKREGDEQHTHERVEKNNIQAGLPQQRDALTVTVETADGLLDQGSDGASTVVVQSPDYKKNSASERTPLLKGSIAQHSQQPSNTQCSNNTTSPAQRAKSVCLWPCRVIQDIASHQLKGFAQLIWDEVVVVLYVIFIMLMFEITIQVSQICMVMRVICYYYYILQVSFPPLVEALLQWHDFQTSIFFTAVATLV